MMKSLSRQLRALMAPENDAQRDEPIDGFERIIKGHMLLRQTSGDVGLIETLGLSMAAPA